MGVAIANWPFFNRELSWLEFNARVLEEALDPAIPLLERLRYLAIVSANFDEFFMVRMSALMEVLRQEEALSDPSGLPPLEIYRQVSARAHAIAESQYRVFSSEILPALAKAGLHVWRPADWKPAVLHYLDNIFRTQIQPVLTPLAVSNEDGAEFPSTGNLRIHAAFLLLPAEVSPEPGKNQRADGYYPGERLTIVQVPANIPRFVPVPGQDDQIHLALLDDIILTFGHQLFSGWKVQERCLFKIARDADISVDELRDDDFVTAMQEVLATRQNSRPIRMSTSGESERLIRILAVLLGLSEADVYRMNGPIDLRSFNELVAMKGFDHLRFPAREATTVFSPTDEVELWPELQRRDILIHLPYDSFSVVTDFFETAARDPAVLALKATLYRTSGDSPVVRALTRAARNGKQVTVVVELKARFDEERNIAWANRLEQAGAIVVYGAAHLKVHAKAALVIRREEDGLIRRYAHVSTGNYNEKTARLYGDVGLLTANPVICSDLGAFFNIVSGLALPGDMQELVMAPFELKHSLIAMIDREAERSTPEQPGMIAAKMNALCDPDVIAALYRASGAGVRIMLNVRGVCQLVPGVPGVSEHIRVVSIIGRYLEHARLFYFRNGGADELYLSSADWMPRNLSRRVELMVPLLSAEIRDKVYEMLMTWFMDNVQARELDRSGVWTRLRPEEGLDAVSAQDRFCQDAQKRRQLKQKQVLGHELKARRQKP